MKMFGLALIAVLALECVPVVNAQDAQAQNRLTQLVDFDYVVPNSGDDCKDVKPGIGRPIKNDGSYVLEVELWRNGELVATSPNILLGQCYRIDAITEGAGLRLKAFAYTGLVWQPKLQFMDIPDIGDHHSFRTYGTTLDPKAMSIPKLIQVTNTDGFTYTAYNSGRHERDATTR